MKLLPNSKKRFLKLLVFILLTIFIISIAKKAANYALGKGIVKLFEDGTSCIVTLENPRIKFFPLRGKVHNVYIRHYDEENNEGFWIDTISVKLDFLKLFSKTVALRALKLDGARATSNSSQSGFLNTLSFVLPERNTTPKAASWKIRLNDVQINESSSANTWLQLKINEVVLLFENLYFGAFLHPGKPTPADVKAGAEIFSLQGGNPPILTFGTINALGTIGGGLVSIKEAIISDVPPVNEKRSTITIAGSLPLDTTTAPYELTFSSSIYKNYLSKLIPATNEIVSLYNPKLSMSGTVSGLLTEPIITGELDLVLQTPLPLFQRQTCTLSSLTSDFKATTNELKLEDIKIDNLFRDTHAQLNFDNELSYFADLQLILNKESEFIRRCLRIQAGIDETNIHPLDSVLKHAIADSQTIVNVSGTINPFVAKGDVNANLQTSLDSVHSTLEAVFDINQEKMHVQVNESGVVPQIDEKTAKNLLSIIDPDSEQYQTTFGTVPHSQLKLDIVYNFLEKSLNIQELDITRYHINRIIARLAPFLPEDIYIKLLKISTNKSQLDLNLKSSYDLGSSEFLGEGTFASTNLNLSILRDASISSNLKFHSKAVDLNNIYIELLRENYLGI
jgi:hypothetical protein